MRKTICILALALLIAATGAYAEDMQAKSTEGYQSTTGSSQQSTGMMGSSAMSSSKGYERAFQATETIGSKVKNQQGQDLGKINDIVFDSSGRMAFVVLSTGGVAGIREKKVAVPFTALNIDSSKNIVLNISKDKMDSARTWDNSILQDPSAAADIYRHFGQQPYWEGTMQKDMQRGTTPGMRQDSTTPSRQDSMTPGTSSPQGGSRW